MSLNITEVKNTMKRGALLLARGAMPLLLALLALGFVGVGSGLASSSAPLHAATVSMQQSDATPVMATLNATTTYVAWTGTNTTHNLNVMTYDSSTQVFGPAQVLTDTTLAGAGPSLAIFNGNLYVAWMGTDHRLNVAQYNPADPTQLANKVTLSETSYNAPSIAVFGDSLYLAWQGTDGRLNIISSTDGSTFNTMVTYNIAIRTSPSLVNANSIYLYIFWEDVSASSFIVVGTYNPSQPAQLSAVVTTNATSTLPVGVVQAPVANATVRVAWRTASDAQINLGYYEGSSNLPVSIRTTQTTPYGPALIVGGHGGAFMSWTGTNAAQNVNVSAENF